MKKFYSLILALIGLCMVVSAQAATVYRSVVFHRTDGTTLALTVESDMTTIVADGELTMSCDLGVLSLPMSTINKWTFSTEPGMDFGLAGVTAPEADAVAINLAAGNIALTGLPEASKVMLTGIDGRVYVSLTATGSADIATSGLHGGVYVLTINDKSLKIALK